MFQRDEGPPIVFVRRFVFRRECRMTQGLMKSCVAQRTGHQIACDFCTPVRGFALPQ